jgi:hypothetical protein
MLFSMFNSHWICISSIILKCCSVCPTHFLPVDDQYLSLIWDCDANCLLVCLTLNVPWPRRRILQFGATYLNFLLVISWIWRWTKNKLNFLVNLTLNSAHKSHP